MDQLLEKAEEGSDPAALLAKPELPPHLELVSDLFWILSGQRPFVAGGMGPPMPRPILIADIWMTAPEWGIEPAYFLRVTAAADQLYMETINRQMGKTQKA